MSAHPWPSEAIPVYHYIPQEKWISEAQWICLKRVLLARNLYCHLMCEYVLWVRAQATVKAREKHRLQNPMQISHHSWLTSHILYTLNKLQYIQLLPFSMMKRNIWYNHEVRNPNYKSTFRKTHDCMRNFSPFIYNQPLYSYYNYLINPLQS